MIRRLVLFGLLASVVALSQSDRATITGMRAFRRE
jgi:hypothetical protein